MTQRLSALAPRALVRRLGYRVKGWRTYLPHLLAVEFFRAEVQPATKYSAHLPQSISKSGLERHPCHRLSKSVTSYSVTVAGSASFDIHVKPKVRRHRQHRSRLSKVFPLNAGALSCWRSRATYPFATNLKTSTFSFLFEQLTASSTSLIIILQACPPLLPNRTALDSITHFCKILPGIQTSFDVATET